MDVERWQKFAFLVGLSGATAAMRQPLGPILADPDTREFLHNLMREVVAVGRAQGVAIAADYADDRMTFAKTAPATMKASLAHDLERGNRLEVDWLAGKVVRARPRARACRRRPTTRSTRCSSCTAWGANRPPADSGRLADTR